MKKTILKTLGLLFSMTSFAQLAPDALSATSFINYFPNATGTSEYVSVYPEVDPTVVVSTDGSENAIKVEYTNSSNGSVKFSPFDLGATGQGPTLVDISSNKVVYLKMKGTYGENIRVNLKNSASYDFVDGYNFKQNITCSNYRWYVFDFSSATGSLDEVIEIEVVHESEKTASGTIYIDSLVIGKPTGFEPFIPVSNSDLSFKADFSNEYYKDALGEASITTTGNEMTVTIEAADDAYAGAGFKVNLNSADKYIDITDNRIVKLSIKGTDDDTIQVNLKNSDNWDYVDGFEAKAILDGGSDYKTYTFDFSALAGDLDEVIYVEVILNQNSQADGMFYINDLEVGDVDAEACDKNTSPLSVASSDIANEFTVSPNPASDVVTVNGIMNASSLSIYNLSGVMIKTTTGNSIEVSDVNPGSYIMYIDTEIGSIQKLLIVE